MARKIFLHPFDSVRDTFVRPSASEKARQCCLLSIETIFHMVKQQERPFIQSSHFRSFMLDVGPLFVADDTHSGVPFFHPWPIERLDSHPILLSDPAVNRAVAISKEAMDRGPPSLRKYGFPVQSRVKILNNVFVNHVQNRPRAGPEGQNESLTAITGWIHLDGYTPWLGPDTVERPEWACNGGWVHPGNKTPHFKAVMYSAISGSEECLLRGEVLTILGIMMERLQLESLRKHLIIPVMLFSFMGPRHGRILLAYSDGRQLIIRKSPLYQFTSRDEGSMELFARYQAAEIGSGVTTSLPTVDRREFRFSTGGLPRGWYL
ncbi:hypothetical protein BDW69DRAFT_179564 [Aspergillus filifer]